MLQARRHVLEGLVEKLSPDQTDSLERVLKAMLPLLPDDRGAARRICRLCEHATCRGDDCAVSAALGP
jgi:hypothetical protein